MSIPTDRDSGEVAAVIPIKGAAQPPAGVDPAVAAETALLLRVKTERDEGAYQSLFAQFASRVNGYLLRAGLSHADSENVLQDIMLAVWQKADLFDPAIASARTWIYSLARNRLIDLKRAEKREASAFELYFLERSDDMLQEEDHLARAFGSKLAGLLRDLPPEQAQVIVMTYVEGKSHREIADELGLPIGTVKSRVRLGYQRLQLMLGEAKA
jgi:RNA polymerase sigma-70 factor (ECF subfamily)